MSYPEKIHQDFNECPHGRHRGNCPECGLDGVRDELIIAMREVADMRVIIEWLKIQAVQDSDWMVIPKVEWDQAFERFRKVGEG